MNANQHEMRTLLAEGETLTVEFKSDAKGLSDRDLVAAVIAMANTEGGLPKSEAGKGPFISENGKI